jgi:hypothetical protein
MRARTLRSGCFVIALFAMLLSATPALAQTVTAMWDPSPASQQVTGYQVCVGTSSLSCNLGLVTKSPSETSHTFAPTAGVRHYVAIRATNAAGASAFSSEVSFSIPSFTQPPNQYSSVGAAITPLSLLINDPDGSALTITQTGLPLGLSINSTTRQITGTLASPGTHNVTLAVNDGLVTVSRSFTWTVTGGLSTDGQMRPAADFDDDGRADMWRYELSGSSGTWRVRASSTATYSTYQWGMIGDIPVPADYDGDGRADITVYRPTTGQWFILKSGTNYTAAVVYNWGMNGDTPVPADYDGDGRADITVYRPTSGRWYILKSGTNYTAAVVYNWGMNGDTPVPADYDGDGRADITLYRPTSGRWYILKSGTNYTAAVVYNWGMNGDTPVPADYDGDGRADITVYRPYTGQWWVAKSTTNYAVAVIYIWGTIGDIPVPAEYDVDGRTDITVYRPSTGQWWILKSSVNYTASELFQWGQ